MPEIQEIPIDSLQVYIQTVDSEQNHGNSASWFRGTGSSEYTLAPSLHRHTGLTTSESLFDMEKSLITRFKERSVPYLKNRIDDSWELLFLMQHYGMPTRLLDWTENPLIALFFALSSARRSEDGSYQNDAAVWVLSPAKWNQTVLSHQSYDGAAVSASDSNVSANYSIDSELRFINEHPIAVLGIHNSPRIVAQRGSFCLFGKSLSPMEQIFTEHHFPDDALSKIIIPADKIEGLLTKLVWMGITDAVVYPDLEGLARETKRQFGYRV